MPIVAPGRRIGVAFVKNSALSKKMNKGKRSGYAALMLTSMVDMFTILVLYLIQQFNATGQILFIDPNIKLPDARRAQAIIGNPPVVTIGKEVIALQGEAVEETNVLDREGNWEAPKLEDALRKMRETSTAVSEATSGQVDTASAQGVLVVQADLGIPYKLIKKAIFIAQKTGFTKIDFAVQKLRDTPAEGAEVAPN
jgi:biopolymer transport protein ExbD